MYNCLMRQRFQFTLCDIYFCGHIDTLQASRRPGGRVPNDNGNSVRKDFFIILPPTIFFEM